ncbi:nadh-quinone oxidoreductase subunit j [Lasius niger]|uniref:NADH-ubiquinone oxidoreductase chain 6 n=1 Tax=Lasius niger TaxID=67767 RepID=A0A0J7KHJ4_LASNI|nr:nadh-quinone oxidoreductase subunit j [Lasius niger]
MSKAEIEQEREWLKPKTWIGPATLSAILFAMIIYPIFELPSKGIHGTVIGIKEVGITLFGPYVLVVELASILLLAGMVVAFHIGRGHAPKAKPSDDSDRTIMETEERI